MKFKVCEHCGANLDPGESCDCQEKSPLERESHRPEPDVDSDKKGHPDANGQQEPLQHRRRDAQDI